jgi:CheY-like chemotaxis protein
MEPETRTPTTTLPCPSALVADDDEDTRTLLAGILRRAGFDVIEVGDGDELVQRFAALRSDACVAPSVVVSDIGMPGRDGIAATQALRSASPVPIVLVTAFEDAETLRSARSAGADLILCKPVDGVSFLHAVLGLTR